MSFFLSVFRLTEVKGHSRACGPLAFTEKLRVCVRAQTHNSRIIERHFSPKDSKKEEESGEGEKQKHGR